MSRTLTELFPASRQNTLSVNTQSDCRYSRKSKFVFNRFLGTAGTFDSDEHRSMEPDLVMLKPHFIVWMSDLLELAGTVWFSLRFAEGRAESVFVWPCL